MVRHSDSSGSAKSSEVDSHTILYRALLTFARRSQQDNISRATENTDRDSIAEPLGLGYRLISALGLALSLALRVRPRSLIIRRRDKDTKPLLTNPRIRNDAYRITAGEDMPSDDNPTGTDRDWTED